MQAIGKQQFRASSVTLLLQFFAIALFLASSILFAQMPKTGDCSKCSSFMALSAKAMESHVLSRADLSGEILATIAAHADIYVRVYVDEQGLVVCARAVGKENLLKSLAEKAAMNWKFSPTVRGGKGVPFQGVIVFHLDI
ncbi:MAG: hypothetical protein ABSC88_01105 [Terracidiphilus sp.]|jgi:hypothetical protein